MMKQGMRSVNGTTRRHFLASAAALPAMAATAREARAAAPKPDAPLPRPRYTLSVNLELMFPRAMPWEERVAVVGREGAKAFSFWSYLNKDLDKIQAAQEKYRLRCGSITGTNKTGWNTGLTRTGYEKEFLDDFRGSVLAAKRLGCPNLISFVGETQKEIPWETQRAQIVAGLKKAGDIAGEAGVYLTLEPLNRVESPQMSVLSARRGFEILEAVGHPHIKLDFDIYHLQLSEGNLTNNLRYGLEKGLIQFVEVGDVPGRFEPGTGETNYVHLFRVLRKAGYAGFVGMEHRSTSTPEHAIRTVRRMAGLA